MIPCPFMEQRRHFDNSQYDISEDFQTAVFTASKLKYQRSEFEHHDFRHTIKLLRTLTLV